MGVERLRFKDENGNFYEGHKTDYLKNVAHIKKGKQLSVKNMIEHGEYYVLNGGIEPSGFTNEWNTESDTISISEGGNSCGYVNLNKEKFWSGGHNYTLQEIQLSLNYLYSFLKYKQLRIMSLRVGSGLPNIQKKALEKLKIKIPDPKEQEKIGNFLSLFYRLIEKLETKVRLLKDLKKGYLQQMFPAKGEKVPKIRFVGFDGDWEQLELNEISSSYSGGTPNVSVSEYYGSDIPFIRSGEIYSSTTELCISFKGIENSSAKMVDKGDILYAMYGANSGEVAISKIHGAINQAILAIKVKKNYNSYLLFQYLKREKNRIISKYLQGGQGNLSGHIIKKIKILMPKKIDEQNNIGNFLQYLDSMIEKHEKELHSIEQLKKGYMQRLFA